MQPVIPSYINKKRNVVRLVLYTALYAELFINIYQPFNSRQWIAGVSDWGYFLTATLAVLVAMLIVALSRTIMYHHAKRHDINYWEYGTWVLAEIVLMAACYTAAPFIALPDKRNELQMFSLFGDAVTYTAFILLIPYAITMMAFILQEQNRKLVQYGLREAKNKETLGLEEMLNFRDEKGELKLSIRPDSLFYIESADNYVNIHYLNAGKIQHFMLRNQLRRIDEMFAKHDLIRCHRSYIVSFGRVRVLKRTDEGLMVDFDYEGVPLIPVSRTYSARVMDRFSRDSGIL